jgi:hypothetical protein
MPSCIAPHTCLTRSRHHRCVSLVSSELYVVCSFTMPPSGVKFSHFVRLGIRPLLQWLDLQTPQLNMANGAAPSWHLVPRGKHGLRLTQLWTNDALWQALDRPSRGLGHGKYRHGSHRCVSWQLQPGDWAFYDSWIVSDIFSNSAISSYALEKFPQQATCVSAILNMWRTCGGFAVGYFQPAWIQRNGTGLVFGIQAAILCTAVVLTITPVLVWERRRWSRVAVEANAGP